MVEALSIGSGKDMVKQAEGYIVSAQYDIGKTKAKKGSTKYSLADKKGEKIDVWGNASINGALCIDGKLNPGLIGFWCKIVFVKMGKQVKGKNPQRICDVFIDDQDKLKTPGSVNYKIKK